MGKNNKSKQIKKIKFNKKLIKKNIKFIGFDLSKMKEMNEVVNVARVRQAVCVKS